MFLFKRKDADMVPNVRNPRKTKPEAEKKKSKFMLRAFKPSSEYSDLLAWLKHENDLLNARMGWIVGINAVMMAVANNKEVLNGLLFWLIVGIGIFWTISVGLALIGGLNNINMLNILIKPQLFRPIIGDEPFLDKQKKGKSSCIINGLLPWKLMPWIFLLAWVVVILFRFGIFSGDSKIQQPPSGTLGLYSQAIKSDGFVYLSGQIPINANTGEIVTGGIAAQTSQALVNSFKALNAAGLTSDDVVKVTVFLTDTANFKAMNEIYATQFKQPCPARSTIGVKELPLGALVEIEMIARRK
jgi:2-iminobutanoate/2-iminopropanoate deaminase